MVSKEFNLRAGVYKVQTFGTLQMGELPKNICIKRNLLRDQRGIDNIPLKIIVCIMLILFIISQAEGKVGYSINVRVYNDTMGSSWGRGHSTIPLSYESYEKYKGDGNSSKYIKIEGFDGINLKETTYTKKGRLLGEKSVSLTSYVNWNQIDEVVSDLAERYRVKINESMPTSLVSVDEITYRGEGIFKKASYMNNDEKITTNYNAKKFSESSAFIGVYRNALIVADITPSRIDAFIGENYSTQFKVTSDSDLYTSFKFKSSNEFIDERYIGSFKTTKKIVKRTTFERPDEEYLVDDWLGCCPSDYVYLDIPTRLGLLCLCRSNLADLYQSTKFKKEVRE